MYFYMCHEIKSLLNFCSSQLRYSKLSGRSKSDFDLQKSRALKFCFEGVHFIA